MSRMPSLASLVLACFLVLAACPVRAEEVTVPPGFLWGAATAAHQVEGGNTRSDWWEWEQLPGKIKHGDRSGAACEHYQRYESDLDRLKAVGANSYRFSLEWARIEPEEGRFDPVEIAHYRAVLQACRDRGLVPMVTLFHFTLPKWFADKGGFGTHRSVKRFERYARRMGSELGDLVDLWCTVNEPAVYLAAAYLGAVFPPQKQSFRAFGWAFVNLLRAHRRGYRALHETDRTDADGDGTDASVGIAKHMRIFDPWDPGSIKDRAIARTLDTVFNQAFLVGSLLGRVRFSLPDEDEVRFVDDDRAAGTLDYFGLNYYSRDMVRFDPSHPGGFERKIPEGAPVNDMGWEIYPEGFYRLLRRAGKFGLPVYVTENGIADAADSRRADFLRTHLSAMGRALREGVDVRGYFHWSLMDNFEWAEGYEPRFGLYAMDYATQTRTLRAGAQVFTEAATSGRIPILPSP